MMDSPPARLAITHFQHLVTDFLGRPRGPTTESWNISERYWKGAPPKQHDNPNNVTNFQYLSVQTFLRTRFNFVIIGYWVQTDGPQFCIFHLQCLHAGTDKFLATAAFKQSLTSRFGSFSGTEAKLVFEQSLPADIPSTPMFGFTRSVWPLLLSDPIQQLCNNEQFTAQLHNCLSIQPWVQVVVL